MNKKWKIDKLKEQEKKIKEFEDETYYNTVFEGMNKKLIMINPKIMSIQTESGYVDPMINGIPS